MEAEAFDMLDGLLDNDAPWDTGLTDPDKFLQFVDKDMDAPDADPSSPINDVDLVNLDWEAIYVDSLLSPPGSPGSSRHAPTSPLSEAASWFPPWQPHQPPYLPTSDAPHSEPTQADQLAPVSIEHLTAVLVPNAAPPHTPWQQLPQHSNYTAQALNAAPTAASASASPISAAPFDQPLSGAPPPQHHLPCATANSCPNTLFTCTPGGASCSGAASMVTTPTTVGCECTTGGCYSCCSETATAAPAVAIAVVGGDARLDDAVLADIDPAPAYMPELVMPGSLAMQGNRACGQWLSPPLATLPAAETAANAARDSASGCMAVASVTAAHAAPSMWSQSSERGGGSGGRGGGMVAAAVLESSDGNGTAINAVPSVLPLSLSQQPHAIPAHCHITSMMPSACTASTRPPPSPSALGKLSATTPTSLSHSERLTPLVLPAQASVRPPPASPLPFPPQPSQPTSLPSFRQLARAAAAVAAAASLGLPPPDLIAMGLLPPGYKQPTAAATANIIMRTETDVPVMPAAAVAQAPGCPPPLPSPFPPQPSSSQERRQLPQVFDGGRAVPSHGPGGEVIGMGLDDVDESPLLLMDMDMDLGATVGHVGEGGAVATAAAVNEVGWETEGPLRGRGCRAAAQQPTAAYTSVRSAFRYQPYAPNRTVQSTAMYCNDTDDAYAALPLPLPLHVPVAARASRSPWPLSYGAELNESHSAMPCLSVQQQQRQHDRRREVDSGPWENPPGSPLPTSRHSSTGGCMDGNELHAAAVTATGKCTTREVDEHVGIYTDMRGRDDGREYGKGNEATGDSGTGFGAVGVSRLYLPGNQDMDSSTWMAQQQHETQQHETKRHENQQMAHGESDWLSGRPPPSPLLPPPHGTNDVSNRPVERPPYTLSHNQPPAALNDVRRDGRQTQESNGNVDAVQLRTANSWPVRRQESAVGGLSSAPAPIATAAAAATGSCIPSERTEMPSCPAATIPSLCLCPDCCRQGARLTSPKAATDTLPATPPSAATPYPSSLPGYEAYVHEPSPATRIPPSSFAPKEVYTPPPPPPPPPQPPSQSMCAPPCPGGTACCCAFSPPPAPPSGRCLAPCCNPPHPHSPYTHFQRCAPYSPYKASLATNDLRLGGSGGLSSTCLSYQTGPNQPPPQPPQPYSSHPSYPSPNHHHILNYHQHLYQPPCSPGPLTATAATAAGPNVLPPPLPPPHLTPPNRYHSAAYLMTPSRSKPSYHRHHHYHLQKHPHDAHPYRRHPLPYAAVRTFHRCPPDTGNLGSPLQPPPGTARLSSVLSADSFRCSDSVPAPPTSRPTHWNPSLGFAAIATATVTATMAAATGETAALPLSGSWEQQVSY